jgi:hypothetical protein
MGVEDTGRATGIDIESTGDAIVVEGTAGTPVIGATRGAIDVDDIGAESRYKQR